MSEPQAGSSANAHLSYPSNEPPSAVAATSSSSQYRQLLQDRLYIGNLHHSVDEYTLVQVFSKFGKISQLDFLFHKTGALKGKPRGYAFVQYANKDSKAASEHDTLKIFSHNLDALKALTMANNKLLRGRKLVVTYAHQAPLDQDGGNSSTSSNKMRKGTNEAGKPTVLSLLKSSGSGGSRSDGTKTKIAMMEAKLKQMERTSAMTSSQSSSQSNAPRHRPPASVLAGKSARFSPSSDSLSSQTIFPRQSEPYRRTSGHTLQSVLTKSEGGKPRQSTSSSLRKEFK